MKKLYLTLMFFVHSFFLFGQNLTNPSMVNMLPGNSYRVKKEIDNNIKGSQYLNSDFLPFNLKGVSINNIDRLRYNNYTDEMEYVLGNEIYNLERFPDMIIIIDQKIYKYLDKVLSNKDFIAGFLEVIFEGKNSVLYKKQSIVIVDKVVKENVMDIGEEIKVYEQIKPQYFIQYDNNLYLIPSKKKDLLKIKGLEKFKSIIENHKINLEKENELINLVELFD